MDRYLGLILTAIILPIVVTVAGLRADSWFQRRLKIRLVHHHRKGSVADIHSLYLHRIEPNERIAPTYITHCLLTQDRCVKSARAFLSLARRNRMPPVMHVLITATSQGTVVGMVKAIFVRSVHLLFIAYVAVHEGEARLERKAMRKMLERLRGLMNPHGPVRWVAFELTKADANAAAAKERLFKQHGQTFGLDLRKVDLEYLQPDLDCVRLSASHEEDAALYLGSTRGPVAVVDLPTLKRILNAIFLEIYLPTWLIDHDRAEERALREYATNLAGVILQHAPDHVALL